MRTPRHFLKTAFLMTFSISLCSCMGRGPVPVDVVMADNELFFMLEKEWEIRSVAVFTRNPKAGQADEKDWKTIWAIAYDPTTNEKKRKYPKLKQIKYGQKIEGFPWVEGPSEPLQKNVEYLVRIELRKKFAREIFIITDDNKAVMPGPHFPSQKGRTYSVLIDKDGNKTLIPSPVPKQVP